jgi:hypothetical protein
MESAAKINAGAINKLNNKEAIIFFIFLL